jgi:pyruvate kinase
MIRRTKILATLGPATDKERVLKKMLAAGVDVVRLNYSHGTADDQARRVEAVRKAAAELGRDVGILADLQGPKIRVESFKEGPVELQEGQPFALDTAWPKDAGTIEVVGCAYTDLPRDVSVGDTLLLNDGAISLKVDKVEGTRISCSVLVGGTLSNRKGINRLGGGLSAAALSFKDRIDIREAVALDVDFIAVSFPRSAADMYEARNLVKEAQGNAALVAKIERAEALRELPEIIGASDAVMVARGDLGVEIGDAELPGWQKKIINQAREQNRMVITATQMMESMITSPIPTRAEVLDVANAVMDGTDAVMLSAETASGKHPVKVVEAMARVCEGAERAAPPSERIKLEGHFERTDEAIAMATTWTARNMHANAIISLTESGSTPLLMSRTDTRIPIYAMTRHERTRRRMGLVRGVYPIDFTPVSITAPIREAVQCLIERKLLKNGDRVLLTKGDFSGPGGTNEMKIIKVGET